MKWVDGTDLAQWAARRDSQALLPEVVRQLVLATVLDARRVDFRSGEGVQLPGWDGQVEAITDTTYVPAGISCWEIGTNSEIARKANDDYEGRTAEPLGIIQNEAIFFFVTPRRWAAKAAWARDKESEGIWRGVRALDADDLEAWVLAAPAVGAWLARKIDKYPAEVSSIDDSWLEFCSMTNPPLTTAIVLAGRAAAQEAVTAWLEAAPSILQLRAHNPAEAIAFFSGHVLGLDESKRDRIRARAIVARNPETVRALSLIRTPLVIISDVEDRTPVGAAVQRGHHVLVPVSAGNLPAANEIILGRATRDAFIAALKGFGYSDEQSLLLTRETGRSIAALQRRWAIARPAGPTWAHPPEVHDLIGLLLAGSWDEARAGDREVLAELAGRPYDEVARLATTWSQDVDSPLRRAGSVYAVSAARDAWEQVGRYVTADALARFARIAEQILSLDDPRLELPLNERWLAGIRDRLPLHSSALREGLALSLILLSVLGEQATIPHRAQDVAENVVGRVLSPTVHWRRWYSVAGILRSLAEAAPNAFLTGLRSQLATERPEFCHLFDEEGGGFSQSSKHTHLLWALEVLAWEPAHLGAVVLLLGKLARLDPGGRLHNRPINSLRGIFLFWHPYTAATLVQRTQALDLLIAREPDIAWQLVSMLLPKSSDHGMPTAEPQWRALPPRQPMTYGERDQAATSIIERALTLAGLNPARLAVLVGDSGQWPPVLRERLVAQLRAFVESDPPAIARTEVWSALREFTNLHRAFADAEWAVPGEALPSLVAVRDLLVPDDRITRYAWLFDDWTPNLGEPHHADYETDYTVEEAAVARARHDALREIVQTDGRAGLLTIAQIAKYPGFIGFAAADIVVIEHEQRALLLDTLGSPVGGLGLLGQSLVARWHQLHGNAWVNTMLTPPLVDEPARTTTFLLGLPFARSVWQRTETMDEEIGTLYWHDVRAWLPRDAPLDDVTYAVDQLLRHDRALDAVHLLDTHVEVAPADLCIRALDGLHARLVTGAPLPQGFRLDIAHVIARLEPAGVPEADIARLEWTFLPLLSHGRSANTLALHRHMSRNPGLFAEAINAVYLPHNRNHEEMREVTEQDTVRAGLAYELLSSWRVPPGGNADGELDAGALDTWVDEARARCQASDRAASGDGHIGQVLAHTPPGADGIWPAPAVRALIDRVQSPSMESGLAAGVYNRRGVFARNPADGGVQERALAAKYHGYAIALALTYPQTAGILRGIAEHYDWQAQREDEHAQQDDLD